MIAAVVLAAMSAMSAYAAGSADLNLRLSDAQQIEVPAPPAVAPVSPEGKTVRADVPAKAVFGNAVLVTGGTPARSGEKAAVVARFEIEPLRNAYLNTDMTFVTAKKTKVVVSGASSANCVSSAHDCDGKNRYYLVLGAAGKIYGANVYKLATSESKYILIAGESEYCLVSVSPNIFSPENSIVEVSQGGRTLFRATAKQAGDALAAKSVKVAMSKNYFMAFGNDMLEDAGLDISQSKDKSSFLFVPSDDAMTNYMIPLDSVTEAGVTFPGFEKDYTFRKTADGFLEILH